MEVHFSQRLILGEWSWSLHRATEKDATVALYKSKNLAKIRKALNRWARQKIGRDDKTEAASSAADVCPHLREKWLVWRGFLHIPVLLLNSGWRFITAQQFGWWLKGGEGKLRIKGKRWRSSRTSPAGPGTCPGQQLQLLLWRKSQLSLATSNLPPVPSPLAPAFIQKPSLSSVFSNSPSYSRPELEN